MIGMETDMAGTCQRTLAQAETENAPEDRRVALATKCVRILRYDVNDLARDARLPRTFIWSFEADVAMLRKFADAGFLTSDQMAVLENGDGVLEKLKKRCGGVQIDGTERKDDLSFDC